MSTTFYSRYDVIRVNDEYAIIALYEHGHAPKPHAYYIERSTESPFGETPGYKLTTSGFDCYGNRRKIPENTILFKTVEDAKLRLSWILLGE